jgi:hypothetical protein
VPDERHGAGAVHGICHADDPAAEPEDTLETLRKRVNGTRPSRKRDAARELLDSLAVELGELLYCVKPHSIPRSSAVQSQYLGNERTINNEA